jgi:hypothetical protein
MIWFLLCVVTTSAQLYTQTTTVRTGYQVLLNDLYLVIAGGVESESDLHSQRVEFLSQNFSTWTQTFFPSFRIIGKKPDEGKAFLNGDQVLFVDSFGSVDVLTLPTLEWTTSSVTVRVGGAVLKIGDTILFIGGQIETLIDNID